MRRIVNRHRGWIAQASRALNELNKRGWQALKAKTRVEKLDAQQ